MRRSCWVAVLTALAACGAPGAAGRGSTPPSPVAGADECAILPVPASAPESLTVAVSDPVRPLDAPLPRNAGERVVFAQLYAPLLDLDCRGRIEPALARAWRADSGARAWMVALGDDARFATGEAVPPSALAGGDASASPDARSVLVFAADSDAAVLRALADPARAPIRAVDGSPWPVGAGRYRVGASDDHTLRLVALPGDPAPTLTIRLIGPRDARDALDEGVDVLVTTDPQAIAYALSRPDLESLPLPWDRSYVLITPPAAGAPENASPGADSSAVALRAALARDAVREEARPSDGPYWWDDAPSCAGEPAGHASIAASSAAPTGRIAYPERDAVARELAERLVALAAIHAPALASAAPTLGHSAALRATGLPPDELARALAAGGDAAYVLPLPARTLDPCRDARALRRSAPWLGGAGAAPFSTLVPLVDTRARAIVRRGTVGLTVDWLGALTFDVRSRSAP